MEVIICGAGVIGAAIAHALTQRGIFPKVVEVCRPGCAASGKSGGFLALDWCDGSDMSDLARRSFELHAGLGEQFGERTGYRRMETLAVVATESASDLSRYQKHPKPDWLDGHCAVHERIGTTSSTAQVHPLLLTQTLLEEAIAAGAELVIGRVEGVCRDADAVSGVRVDGTEIPADAVIIAMGPWSTLASEWLPLPPIMGQKGASIVLQPETPVSAHALFGQFIDTTGGEHTPEVFPRPDGRVYLCGAPDQAPLPLDPDAIAPSKNATDALRTIARSLSGQLARAQVVHRQACYRPIVADGLPVIGTVPGVRGAYIATAHNCWGILNAPATGECMAELLTSGQTSHVDIRPFAPGRVM